MGSGGFGAPVAALHGGSFHPRLRVASASRGEPSPLCGSVEVPALSFITTLRLPP